LNPPEAPRPVPLKPRPLPRKPARPRLLTSSSNGLSKLDAILLYFDLGFMTIHQNLISGILFCNK
uniref:Uncharacterized protein n=1 Tax=Amphimedon queenslandica TaxID=400682 RepID=A0A1X7V8A6_AMPQE